MPARLKDFLKRWAICTLAVLVAAHVVEGISYDKGDWPSLLVATLVRGLLNTFPRPLLMFLSLPLVVLSLGLFTVVINAFLLYLVGSLFKMPPYTRPICPYMGVYGGIMTVVENLSLESTKQKKGMYFEFPKDFADKLDALARARGHPKVRVLQDVFNAGLAASAGPGLDNKAREAITALITFFTECLEKGWGQDFSDFADSKGAPDRIDFLENLIKPKEEQP